MHPNFWLIMVCAIIAIGAGVFVNKKRNRKITVFIVDENISIKWAE